MKIAITSTGKDLNSDMDPRFGRARYLLILDENGNLIESFDNSANINAMQGAGIQAAKTVFEKGVNVLVTGRCGPNAFKTLQAAGVKVVVDQSGPVLDAVAKLKSGKLEFASQANTEGHW
jgi:predicted Fe-Mo cluster-binding NifX family protein